MTRAVHVLAYATLLAGCYRQSHQPAESGATTRDFAKEVRTVLPEENSYAYHKRLSDTPVHTPRRDVAAGPQPGELVLADQGWKLVWNRHSSPVLQNAVQDFQDYLDRSMQVQVQVETRDSLEGWQFLSRSIVVGTRDQLAGCGTVMKGPKAYQIVASHEKLTVCGYDERGAMFGLFNVEARMNLREAPFSARRPQNSAEQPLRFPHGPIVDGMDGISGYAACPYGSQRLR